jgi:hypothetical protein
MMVMMMMKYPMKLWNTMCLIFNIFRVLVRRLKHFCHVRVYECFSSLPDCSEAHH